MTRYAYPGDFAGTLWNTLDADSYVSPQGDDVAGDGSPGSPYRSVQAACDAAPEGGKIIIGAGIYREAVDGGLKDLTIAGEGEAILDGATLTAATAFGNMGQGYRASVRKLTIRNYRNALDGPVRKVLDCRIIDSHIAGFSGLLEYCLIKNSLLEATGSTDLVNCTLINARCGDNAAGTDQFRMVTNTFLDAASRVEADSTKIEKLDYCALKAGATLQIDGIPFDNLALFKTRYPQWQGSRVSTTPGFHSPDTEDYTLRQDSDLLEAGRYGHFIGAYDAALRLEAGTMETGQLVNIQRDGNGYFEIANTTDLSGTIVTREIDLGKLTLPGRLRVFSDQDISDPLNGRVDYDNTARASNLCTYKMRFSTVPNDLADKEYGEFIWNEPPMTDKNGRGNGDPAFRRSSAAMVTARYLQIKVTIQTFEAFGLLTESGDFLVQEDSDLTLL